MAAVAVLAGLGCDPRAPAAGSQFSDVLDTVIVVSDGAPVEDDGQVVATAPKGRLFGVLDRRGVFIEVQSCDGGTIRRGWIHQRYLQSVADGGVDLVGEAIRLALVLERAKQLQPRVREDTCRANLEALARRVASAAAEAKAPRERARRIGEQLFLHEGFAYQAVSKSLDVLLDYRRGDCFALSLLYLLVARELGMPLYLVCIPGHAFVRYDDGQERFNIEPAGEGEIFECDENVHDDVDDGWRSPNGMLDFRSLPPPRALGILHATVADALDDLGQYEQASEHCATALEINPTDAYTLRVWGTVYEHLGRKEKATDRYARAMRLVAPRNAADHLFWGIQLWALLRDLDGAIAQLDEALRQDPKLKGYVEATRHAILQASQREAADELDEPGV